jgi:hypothetical protein
MSNSISISSRGRAIWYTRYIYINSIIVVYDGSNSAIACSNEAFKQRNNALLDQCDCETIWSQTVVHVPYLPSQKCLNALPKIFWALFQKCRRVQPILCCVGNTSSSFLLIHWQQYCIKPRSISRDRK